QSHRIPGDDIWCMLTIPKGVTRENHPDFSGVFVSIWIFNASAGYLARAQTGFERKVMFAPNENPFLDGPDTICKYTGTTFQNRTTYCRLSTRSAMSDEFHRGLDWCI